MSTRVCTCRISSRPRTAVLTSSIADSAEGSRSGTSRGPEHTRERLATCAGEKRGKTNKQTNTLSHCSWNICCWSYFMDAGTRSMMSSKLVKWCVLQPSARSTSSWVACFLTAKSRSSAIPLSWGITTVSINSSWKIRHEHNVIRLIWIRKICRTWCAHFRSSSVKEGVITQTS